MALEGRWLSQARRCLGPQVLELLRRGGATQYLVAVRVAPKARDDAAGSPSLRDHELSHYPQVGRSVGCFLLSVLNATLVEGDLFGVTQRQPEKDSLHAPVTPERLHIGVSQVFGEPIRKDFFGLAYLALHFLALRGHDAPSLSAHDALRSRPGRTAETPP